MMRVTFLGTSAAQPTLSRNLSGISVRREHEHLLFDCGEGSQRQMMRYGTGFAVDRIFFTHFHGDHFLGLLGFLRTLNMQGRVEPLNLYGPSPAASLLDRAVRLGFDPQSFEILVHELKGGDEVAVHGGHVTAIPVEHRIPAFGYLLREAERPGEFHPEKAIALGVSEGPLFGELQRGVAVVVGGREIHPDEVLGPSRPGRSLVVSGDTRPCASLETAARSVDVLIHEATFVDAEHVRALETQHCTAREASALAARAGARRLLLTHFSSRYDDGMATLLAEAREEFAGVELAYDGLTFDVPLPG
jgi:ribonuclease Z